MNNQVKYALEKNFSYIWVEGEISAPRQYPSGHLYFTLKDASSEISCVLFSSQRSRLEFVPAQGQKVLVTGSVSLYLPRGQYQLTVKHMYPAGQGALWLAYEKLKKRLEDEGLFSTDRKQDLPAFPSRIGVVTSSAGSVLRDIIDVVSRRAPHVEILIRPCLVQGNEAAADIAQGIRDLNIHGGLDLIIVGRGGGSLEDLWCFNAEEVAYAIAESGVPIISAVGHETDFTIADFVADQRAPTPSAAAEIAVPVTADLLQAFDYTQNRLTELLLNHFDMYKKLITALESRHAFQKPGFMLERIGEKLFHFTEKLCQTLQTRIRDTEKDILQIHDRLTKMPQNILEQNRVKINALSHNLGNLNPAAVLDRGYSLVFDKHKRLVKTPNSVKKGDDIHVKFSQGNIHAKVNDTQMED